jgi:hypothetical protein
MTAEETHQVQTYIAQLQSQHAAEITALKIEHSKQLGNSTKHRHIAVKDRDQMGLAVHEIWKLANSQSTITPAVMAQYTRQIINYYCPDFDIPF